MPQKTGAGTLTFDVEGYAVTDIVGDSTNTGNMGWRQKAIASSGDYDGATKTLTLTKEAIVIGHTAFIGYSNDEAPIETKLRLFIDGVQVAESIAFLCYTTKTAGNRTRSLVGNKACSAGNVIIVGTVHNYGGDSETICYIYYGCISGGGAVRL